MARDKFHYNVRTALEKDGWTITDDPLKVKSGDVKGEIDLGAEKLIGAEKDGKRIAVEIKGFSASFPVKVFAKAYGKFKLCRWILSKQSDYRDLYLAIPKFAYHSFFQRPLIVEIIKVEHINLVIFDELLEEVCQWINW